METVEIVNGGAAALSSYGLYAVCAALVVVVIHLYRRVNQLETRLCEAVKEGAEARGRELAKWQELNTQTQEVIKANTKALEKVLDALEHRGR